MLKLLPSTVCYHIDYFSATDYTDFAERTKENPRNPYNPCLKESTTGFRGQPGRDKSAELYLLKGTYYLNKKKINYKNFR